MIKKVFIEDREKFVVMEVELRGRIKELEDAFANVEEGVKYISEANAELLFNV